MKHFYILLFSLISIISQAQNWQPFPYDSVYFINAENDKDILIPVVKTPDSTDLLINMGTYGHLGIIDQLYLEYTPLSNIEYEHWFGKDLNYSSGHLTFNSLIFDDSLNINLNGSIHEADTQDIYINDSLFYFAYSVDSIYYDQTLNDTLKSIKIALLGQNFDPVLTEYQPHDYLLDSTFHFYHCLNSLLDVTYSTNNRRILIGKTTGIQEIPNLAFYPYCGLYKKYVSVDSLKHRLTIPMFETGDRIDETVVHVSGITWDSSSRVESKKVITSLYINPFTETYDYTADYWERTYDYFDGDSIISETFEPNKPYSTSYTVYNSSIFGSLNQPPIHMNTEWGIPMVGHVNMNGAHFSGGANFANLSIMSNSESGQPYLDSRCVTYHTLNDEEFGSMHNIDVEENIAEPFESWLTQETLFFNTPIQGRVSIYSIDGKQVASMSTPDQSLSIPIANLESGMYLVVLHKLNTTVKIIVN